MSKRPTSNLQVFGKESYWVHLLRTSIRTIQGKYRTRIIEAGTGPALMLLHGNGGHAESYVRNIAPLAERFRVVALDFLWHGLSQTSGFEPEIIPPLVGQVVDVMDVLGIDRAAIEGQSLGGWVAMQVALRHPARVDKLVLTTTMGYLPDPGTVDGYVEPAWASNMACSLEALRNPSFENVRSRLERIVANPDALTDEAVRVRQALYSEPTLSRAQQAFVVHYLGGQAPAKHLVTDSMARTINQPTLVYWGDRNRTPPSLGVRLSQVLPRGRFHCAKNTGHWAQFESAAEHNEVVADFLSDA